MNLHRLTVSVVMSRRLPSYRTCGDRDPPDIIVDMFTSYEWVDSVRVRRTPLETPSTIAHRDTVDGAVFLVTV